MAWAADDTAFPKDGDHSVGVQRQSCGTLGKTANCQLGVSVNAVTEQASCPLNWRLFLPASWEDEARRRAAGHLPDSVHHRPKGQLVLDMLDELDQWGLRPPVLVADAGYGEVAEFRQGLDDRQIGSVVQVKADTWASPEQARPTVAPYTGRGRRPSRATATSPPPHPACPGRRPVGRRGLDLARRQQGPATLPIPGAADPPGRDHPRRQAAARADGVGWELPVCWLLVEWPTDKAEPVKDWLSNLPQTTPLVELVRLGKLRWRIEQDDRELKGALGLDHFEAAAWAAGTITSPWSGSPMAS